MPLYAIDGTYSEQKHRSNVYYFAKRYRDPGGRAPVYYSGPGTPSASAGFGIAGALFGTGSRRIAEQIVERIGEHRRYDMNAPIDIIGFSRGAAIANEVAWLLGTKGIVRERRDDTVIRDVPSIRFLGLFDPVHSMGFPIPTFSGPIFLGNRRWCASKIPDNVKTSVVIYAKDERRELFRPSNLVAPVATRGHFHRRPNQPGDHSDTGGHIENNQVLARMALRRMIEEAVRVDVPVSTHGLITEAEIDAASGRGALRPTAGYGQGSRPYAR
jgi:Uncharacterized alpha/beta hydrolase domain (DUF2235)